MIMVTIDKNKCDGDGTMKPLLGAMSGQVPHPGSGISSTGMGASQAVTGKDSEQPLYET